MELKFIPVDYDYFDFQGKNYIRVIGRDDKSKRVCIIDSFDPFLWAIFDSDVSEKKVRDIQKKIEKIEIKLPSRTTKIEKTEIHNKKFLGKTVRAIKIFITNYKDAHLVADKIDFKEIKARREYDINLLTKYILEKKLIPLSWYKISGEILNNSPEFGGIDSAFDIDICIKAEKIQKIESLTDKKFKPKILAFDIESDELDLGKGEILMISLVSDNFKKVLSCNRGSEKLNYVEYFKNEAEMLSAFVGYVKKISPDILVGYFSDGFDMPYLKARAEKNKIKLALGLDKSQPSFFRGRIPKAKIAGIVHVDLFRFIDTVYSQYLKSETLGLNEVAFELLGEGKKEFDHKHSSKIKKHEWKDYFEYNLQDSILTYKLAEKFWSDMLEFSKIIQEPLFEITRNSMSKLLENYILHHLAQYNEIAEKKPLHDEINERRGRKRVEGAFVLEPKAGLYKDIVIFDFTSMHTSIIVSFNISKATLLSKKEKKAYESPEVEFEGKKTKFYFSKKQGFLPAMFKELIEKRKRAKKEYKQDSNPITKARSNAFKLLSAAVHGYVGFFGARYYSLESSASILAFVRKFNKETIEKTRRAGYKVIYSDTDSVAFVLEGKTKKLVLQFLEKLNSELPGIMELELEDFYKKGIWVTKRTGKFGAKKKYALLAKDGSIKIRGFETVRRDWCALAKEVQHKVLYTLLREGKPDNALAYVRKIVIDIEKRKISNEKMIIKTQLKKEISSYEAITPHVVIAKRMQELGMPVDPGTVIRFIIAEGKGKSKKGKNKGLVRERAKLPDEVKEGKYDTSYYIERQIISAVENIFDVFNITRQEIVDGKKQKKLGEF